MTNSTTQNRTVLLLITFTYTQICVKRATTRTIKKKSMYDELITSRLWQRNKQNRIYPCNWGGTGSRRIEIISIGSDRVFVGFRPEFHRVPSNSDEIRVGVRLKGIRQKLCRIRSVFYEKCRIPMKSDAGPIENDRIYRSYWLSWVAGLLVIALTSTQIYVEKDGGVEK